MLSAGNTFLKSNERTKPTGMIIVPNAVAGRYDLYVCRIKLIIQNKDLEVFMGTYHMDEAAPGSAASIFLYSRSYF